MIVLGIESCGDIGSVALVDDGKIIGELSVDGKKNHSVTLAPMVADLLKSGNITLGDVSGIAVDVGPGSFTGLRIGISLAASIAYGKDIKVVRVTALDGLYHMGRKLAGSEDITVIPMIFGRKNEIYVKVGGEYIVSDVKEYLSSLDVSVKYLFIGDGSLVFADVIGEMGFDQMEVDRENHYLKASTIAEIGYGELLAGNGISPLSVEPLYIRRPEAEVNLEMKIKNDKC